MKKFADFKIQVQNQSFAGDKIKISKIINRQIVVHDFKIEDSKVNTGKCLYLQIEMKGDKYVVFTGAKLLIESIQRVPKEGFPFETTIIQENETYQFT